MSSTAEQYKRAIQILEQIQSLEGELRWVLGFSEDSQSKAPASSPVSAVTGARKRGGKRTFSAESRAKMAAAQKARWAGKTATPVASSVDKPKAGKKAKRQVSPEVRARLAAAMKARWAAAKKKGLPGPNSRK